MLLSHYSPCSYRCYRYHYQFIIDIFIIIIDMIIMNIITVIMNICLIPRFHYPHFHNHYYFVVVIILAIIIILIIITVICFYITIFVIIYQKLALKVLAYISLCLSFVFWVKTVYLQTLYNLKTVSYNPHDNESVLSFSIRCIFANCQRSFHIATHGND